MTVADVLAWLESVEWATVALDLGPFVLVLVLFWVLVRVVNRKTGETRRILDESREVLRRIEQEHEQASWLLGRMKEKIEEKRRGESRKAAESTLDRLVFEWNRIPGGSLNEARRGLDESLASPGRSSMVELVDTAQGVCYVVPKKSALHLESMRKERLTKQELDEWARKVDTGEEIPF